MLLTGINFQRSSRCARFRGSASAARSVELSCSWRACRQVSFEVLDISAAEVGLLFKAAC